MSRNPFARGETNAPRSRRSLLKLLGAGAVGLVGGAAARSDTAQAADGAAILAGQTNSATLSTKLSTGGNAISNDGAFVVEATAADWALEGDSGNLGVLGSGFIGVMGTGDVGGFFSGNLAAISLKPQSASGAPTSGDYSMGDMLVDSDGVLFICVASGNPGTWVQVATGSSGPSGLHLLSAPARAYDSRNDAAGKLTGGTASPRSVAITSVVTQIPNAALGLVGNLAVTQTGGSGFATIWPSGSWPGTANINFGPGVDLSNAFTVGLGTAGTVLVASPVPTHVVIDIAGYFL